MINFWCLIQFSMVLLISSNNFNTNFIHLCGQYLRFVKKGGPHPLICNCVAFRVFLVIKITNSLCKKFEKVFLWRIKFLQSKIFSSLERFFFGHNNILVGKKLHLLNYRPQLLQLLQNNVFRR